MPIENVQGATVITGNAISLFRLMSIRGRLKLELKGIKFRGGSTFTVVKKEFNLKGSREKVLEQFEAIVEAAKEKQFNGDRALLDAAASAHRQDAELQLQNGKYDHDVERIMAAALPSNPLK